MYTAALAGVGFAVGGLVRTSIAAEVLAVIVVVTLVSCWVAGASADATSCAD
jgi:hypothetical protein